MRIPNLYMRFLLMFLFVVMLTLGASAVFTSQIVKNELQSYVGNNQAVNQKLTTNIQATYNQTHNVQRIQLLTEQYASQSNIRVLVIGTSQRIIADSAHQLVDQTLTASLFFTLSGSQENGKDSPFSPPVSMSSANPTRIISTNGRVADFGRFPLPSPTTFINSIDRSLMLTTLFVGLIVLLLTVTVSQAILKPVLALTQAARHLEQGDLSQRVNVKIKDEIGDLAHAFNVMAEGLEHSEQLQRNFISDIAHELRTPLTNIRGYLEALQDQVIEPEPSVILSIHEETMLLSRLVVDLQDLTLAEAGQLHLQRIPVALEDIITTSVNSLLLQAREKDILLCVEVPTRELPLVEVDPQRVGQILRNLLSNAIKHTPPCGKIYVYTQVVRQEVEVQIQDTGEGIADKHLPSLFKRFYRADPSRSRATGGTGLGLAIVEKLVHAHGGHVQVQSQLGQGTCFTFTLPVAPLHYNTKDIPTYQPQ